jgi:3-hydroxyisobutyrate dehydrogenase-like beta-hydroxyacid dehydrogenase
LVSEGAQAAADPAAMARQADILIACLPNADIVEQVVSGPNGILDGCRPGQVFIDMTTNYPEASIATSQKLAGKGAGCSTRRSAATWEPNKALSIMCGGRWTPERCLRCFRRWANGSP